MELFRYMLRSLKIVKTFRLKMENGNMVTGQNILV